MKHIKSFNESKREDDIIELSQYYGQDKISILEEVIQYLKDICLDLEDSKGNFLTMIDFTPLTWAHISIPEIYILIKFDISSIDKEIEDDLNNTKDSIIRYLESKDDELNYRTYNRDRVPEQDTDFEFQVIISLKNKK